jgi:hypothetical protein
MSVQMGVDPVWTDFVWISQLALKKAQKSLIIHKKIHE